MEGCFDKKKTLGKIFWFSQVKPDDRDEFRISYQYSKGRYLDTGSMTRQVLSVTVGSTLGYASPMSSQSKSSFGKFLAIGRWLICTVQLTSVGTQKDQPITGSHLPSTVELTATVS